MRFQTHPAGSPSLRLVAGMVSAGSSKNRSQARKEVLGPEELLGGVAEIKFECIEIRMWIQRNRLGTGK